MSLTLAFLEPGHFHAALTLRRDNPRVNSTVHLYAPPGAEHDAFEALVRSFNTREEQPTRWQIALHESEDPLQALLDDGLADAVVLAGRNNSKLQRIAALHEACLPVLADKPWLIHPRARAPLLAACAGPPLAMDIMTERHAVLARLRVALAACAPVFGEFACDDPQGPAIEIGSTHHLFKKVNGKPLIRPAWYYDVEVQGDGLVDIQSHMTDQVHMLVGESVPARAPFDLERDVSDLVARRSDTPVPLELFRDSTGLEEFPPGLAEKLDDGVLPLPCNSEIEYRLAGVPVKQSAYWGQREPQGGGDLHAAHLRGTRSEVILRHGPETGYVGEIHVRPRPGVGIEDALRAAVAGWQEEFSALGVATSALGFKLTIPDALRTASAHERLFPMVLDSFLDHLDSKQWPAELAARIRMRYLLLAAAKEQ